MERHGIILFSFLALVAGVVALVVAALGARRTSDRYRASYLAFLSTFTASLFLYILLLYAEANFARLPTAFLAVWGVLDGFADLAIVVTGVFFFHALYEITYARSVHGPILGVSAVILVVFVASGWRAVVAETPGIPAELYLVLGYYYLLFLYLLVLNAVSIGRLRGFRRRFFGYGLFAFLLVGAVESVLSIPHFADATLTELISPRDFYISIVPYLIWSVASSVLLWRTDHQADVTSPSQQLTRFCSRYGITPREREILVGISRGWSNREIADRLFISLQTVKTHAHHLYQKTGAAGRTALLASIQSFD